MSIPTFQVTSTTHESEDDDCFIVSDVKHRLVNRPEQSLDDEVDAGLSAFGILIGNLTTPQVKATVKTEPTDDDDSTSRDMSFEQDREVAAKKNVCSHNRHGDEIDHAVSIPFRYKPQFPSVLNLLIVYSFLIPCTSCTPKMSHHSNSLKFSFPSRIHQTSQHT